MLLVDTNIFLAAADRRSDRHGECAALLAAHRGELAAPVPVIAETSWLILDRLGTDPHREFIRLVVKGDLESIDLTLIDWARVLDLVEQYADLHLDLMDAALVAIAERLDLSTIATINRRDFAVVRPAHRDAFELVP